MDVVISSSAYQLDLNLPLRTKSCKWVHLGGLWPFLKNLDHTGSNRLLKTPYAELIGVSAHE